MNPVCNHLFCSAIIHVHIKNYYMYKHKDSLWHVIPWDVNESFGGVMGASQNNSAHSNWDVLRWFEPDEPNRPLIWQILKHDRYHKQYFAHIRTVIEENYNEANIRSQVDSIQDLIEQDVLNGPYNIFPDQDFRDNVDYDVTHPNLAPLSNYKAMIPTVNERLDYLTEHPEIIKIAPTLENTTRNIVAPEEGQDVWVTAEVTNAMQVDLLITTNREYASFFEPFEMKDDGLNNDGAAGDGVYGVLIPFQSADEKIKYYVRAQNSEAMILEPRRAEYEYFKYKIDSASTASVSDNVEISKLFNVYPNPANGFVNIAGDLEMVNSLKILDATGKLVYLSDNPSSKRISIADLSNGLYFVSLLTDEGLGVKKLMVNK